MTNKTLMTIPERIEMMKKSKAYSPEDAAQKVYSISRTLMENFVTEDPDGYIGVFDDTQNYGKYCGMIKSDVEKGLCREDKSVYETEYGDKISDQIITAAFAAASIDGRFDNKANKPHIYYDMRMTLEDYLDALIDLSIKEDGTEDLERADKYRKLKREFSECCDLSKPLCGAVGDLFEQYGKPLAELGKTSHIIGCDSGAKYQLQLEEMREEFLEDENRWYYDHENGGEFCDDISSQEEAVEIKPAEIEEEVFDEVPENEAPAPVSFIIDEEFFSNKDAETEETARERAERYMLEMDPIGYYLNIAREEPKGRRFHFESGGQWSDSLLLAAKDHSPEAYKKKADKADLYPCFRELVDELVTEEKIVGAFKEINAAVSRLYRLLIEPFADLEKYHFERHLADEA